MSVIVDVLDAKMPEPGSTAHVPDLQAAILDVLDVMVKYSPKPMSELLLQRGFVKVCKCILELKDVTITQVRFNRLFTVGF